jgi:flavin reductase (DIM6/NTAB) family NADH-FMN oxidoreductase RutF
MAVAGDLGVQVDDGRLREVMARSLTGVAVVTAPGPDGPVGGTVSSFTSVALEPPTMLVCLERAGRVHAGVSAAGCYAINILAGSQARLARRFAERGLDQGERFRWLDLGHGVTGSPLIGGVAAWLDCRVREVAYHRRTLGPLR